MPEPCHVHGPSSGRLEVIDGLRGGFLAVMTLGHVHLAGGVFLQKFHPQTFSLVDAAYGFVFVSGIVSGLVYGKTMLRNGYRAAQGRLLDRALTVYLYATGLIFGLAAMVQLFPASREFWGVWLGPLAEPDLGVVAVAALLLQHVELADILGQYVVYLLVAAPALWLCLTGRVWWAVGLSATVWAATQLGATTPVVSWLVWTLKGVRSDLYLPEVFNLAGWQLLFVCGLALGSRTARGGPQVWAGLFRPERRRLAYAALLLCVIFAALNRIMLLESPSQPLALVQAFLDPLDDKQRVGLLNLLDVAVIAWLVGWLTTAAPQAREPWVRAVGALARQVLCWSFLQRLGRHSMLVYVWQVALVYGVAALDWAAGPFPEPVRSLIAVAAIAALILPVLWRERAREPVLESAPAQRTGGA